MIISYINSVFDTTNGLASSTESSTRPLSNLREKTKSLPFRTVGIEGQYIDIFNVNGITADYIGILNHNITSATTITLMGNDTNNFTSPSFSTTITYSSDDIAYKFNSTSQTFKYWRLKFTGGTSATVEYNSGCYSGGVLTGSNIGYCYGEVNYYTPATNTDSNYIEIGVVWLGDSISPEFLRQNMKLSYNAVTRRSESVNGSIYGSLEYEYRSTEIELPILKRSTSEKAMMTTFFRYVKNYEYFLCQIWNDDLTEEEPFYCVYDDKSIVYKKEKSRTYPFSTKIKIREVN